MGNLISLVGAKVDIMSVYLNYLEAQQFTYNEERTSSGLGVVLRIVTAFYILYASKNVLRKQPKLTIYFLLFFIASILSNVFFSIEIIGRVLNYFNICFAIVIASSVYYSTKKYEKIMTLLLLAAYLLVFNVQLYRLSMIGESL